MTTICVESVDDDDEVDDLFGFPSCAYDAIYERFVGTSDAFYYFL